jgi:hypothetical protein
MMEEPFLIRNEENEEEIEDEDRKTTKKII